MQPSAPSERLAGPLPSSIFGYVWRTDARNQLLLALLTVVVFLLRWRRSNASCLEPSLTA